MRVWRATPLLLGSLFLSSCGGSSPSEPSPCLNLAATWRVHFNDTCPSVWSDQVVITQDGCRYSGTASLIPLSFEGTISGKSVTIRITYSGACPGTATGTGEFSLEGVSGTFTGERSGAPGCCNSAMSGSFAFLPPF